MKSFEEWLSEFRRGMNESIQRCRFDEELAEHILEEEKFSNYIFRKKEPDKQESLPEGGTMITLSPLITETVAPERIRIKADLGKWANDLQHIIMDVYLEDLGRLVVAHEAMILINGLLKSAKEFEAEASEISKPDIKKAVGWIHQNALSSHVYPNTLVVNPSLEAEFEKRGDIVEAYRLPKGFIKGPHFSGIINGLNVFSIPYIPPKIILIYDKHEICLRRTTVKINFDNIEKPRYLWIEEERKVWSKDPNALAKIVAKTTV